MAVSNSAISWLTATRMAERAIASGTSVVGGVNPGKGGGQHLNVPLFDSVAEAREATGADASAVFVPPENAAAAMIEAEQASSVQKEQAAAPRRAAPGEEEKKHGEQDAVREEVGAVLESVMDSVMKSVA